MIPTTINKWLRTLTSVGLFLVTMQAVLSAFCAPHIELSESLIEENTKEKYCAFDTLERFISPANRHLPPEEPWILATHKRVKNSENLRSMPDSQERYLNI